VTRQRALESVPASAQQSKRDRDGADLLTQVEVCRILGISDASWMRWRAARRTPEPVTLPSGRLKWRREDIDRIAGKPVLVGGPRRYFGSVAIRGRG